MVLVLAGNDALETVLMTKTYLGAVAICGLRLRQGNRRRISEVACYTRLSCVDAQLDLSKFNQRGMLGKAV